MMGFCIFSAVFEAFVMIATHGHYIIDILAGYVMGHYTSIIGDDIATRYLDNSIVGFNHNNILDAKIEEGYGPVPNDDIEIKK